MPAKVAFRFQLSPRTEAFYNAQRLAREEESRQERQRRQARRPVREVAPDHTCVARGALLPRRLWALEQNYDRLL